MSPLKLRQSLCLAKDLQGHAPVGSLTSLIHTYTLSHTPHQGLETFSLHAVAKSWESSAAKLMTTSIMEKQARLLSSKLFQGNKPVEVVLNSCVFVWREVERGGKTRSGNSSLPDQGECDVLLAFA